MATTLSTTSSPRPNNRAIAEKPSIGSWVDQMKGKTVPQLTAKILRLASNKIGGSTKKTTQARFTEIEATLTKLRVIIKGNATNVSFLSGPNGTHYADLLQAIAYIIPTPADWAGAKHESQAAVTVISKILEAFDMSNWDFEHDVPVAVKALYVDETKPHSVSEKKTNNAPNLLGKAGWKKVKKVVAMQAIVKRFNGTDRNEAQERFNHLGTSAPLLYIMFAMHKGEKRVEEPAAAVTLLQALITAGAHPGRYHDAILTQAILCRWTNCVNVLKQHCSAEIVASAERKVARATEQEIRFKSYGAKTKDIPTLRTEASAGLILHFESQQHADFVNYAQLNHDNTRMTTCCSDGTVHILGVPAGGIKSKTPAEILVRVRLEGSVMHCAWSPDHHHLAIASSSGVVAVVDGDDGVAVMPNLVHINPETDELSKVYTVEYSPDGKFIATCAYDGIIRLFDAATGEFVCMSDDLEDGVFKGIYCGDDGSTFVGVWQSGYIRVFNITNTNNTITNTNNTTTDSSSTTTTTTTATNTTTTTTTMAITVVAETGNPCAMHNNVSASKDGKKFVVAGGDGIVRVHSARDASCLSTLPQHGASVSSAHFCSDDSVIITATATGVLRIFEATQGELLACSRCPFDPKWVQSVSISDDSKLIVVASTDGCARTMLFSMPKTDFSEVDSKEDQPKPVEFRPQVLTFSSSRKRNLHNDNETSTDDSHDKNDAIQTTTTPPSPSPTTPTTTTTTSATTLTLETPPNSDSSPQRTLV